MKKWIVWKSSTEGDFVRATKVIRGRDTVSFIKETDVLDVIVKTYKWADIKGYKRVE